MQSAPETAAHIVPAETPAQISVVRELFLEYAQSLDFSLCFQSFDRELATLPGDYAPRWAPPGCGGGWPHRRMRCVSQARRWNLRDEAPRRNFRGLGLGRRLAEAVIAEARAMGCARMRLDTVADSMREAVTLYRTLGFREIAPYRKNPLPSALYMELLLTQ
jgi:GNAT superfamily N-acetyltransferase